MVSLAHDGWMVVLGKTPTFSQLADRPLTNRAVARGMQAP
jgi:hypothetical protein